MDSKKTTLDFNKNSVIESVKTFHDRIIQKEIDPVLAGILIKRMKVFTEKVYDKKTAKGKEVKDLIANATKTAIEDGTLESNYGTSASHTAVYTKWDFSQCGHPELEQIEELIAVLKARKNVIEEDLKNRLKSVLYNNSDLATEATRRVAKGFDIKVENVYELKVDEGDEIATVKLPKRYQGFGIKYQGIR